MQIKLKKPIRGSYGQDNNLIKIIFIFWFLLIFTGSSSFNDGNSQSINVYKKNTIKINKYDYLRKKTDSLNIERNKLVVTIKETLDTIKQQQKQLKNEEFIKLD